MKRLVVLPWTCQRSGDCCQGPALTMLHSERAELEQRADQALTPLVFVRHDNPTFTMLEGVPCPFFGPTADGTPGCRVYDARPFNCRRFACYRPDPPAERFEQGDVLGCLNASDRFRQSPAVKEAYRQLQESHRTWAWTHGWVD